MNELERIADQLKRAYEGPAWSGPSLLEALQDVTGETACTRAVPNTHTIWEIVHHVSAWEDIATRRLQGERYREYSGAEDWPPVRETTAEAWRAALDHLKVSTHRLRDAVLDFQATRLSEVVPGSDYSFYVLMHGAIQHNLYHAGQIALLKKVRRA